MIHFNYTDLDFAANAAEVMADRIYESDDYTLNDRDACKKLADVGNGGTGLLLTGNELTEGQAKALMRTVIAQEVAVWVPNSSQRLIERAARALGIELPSNNIEPDHGSDRAAHPLIRDWVVGVSVMRCATCGRLFLA